jgi:hypothetical protein
LTCESADFLQYQLGGRSRLISLGREVSHMNRYKVSLTLYIDAENFSDLVATFWSKAKADDFYSKVSIEIEEVPQDWLKPKLYRSELDELEDE